MPLTFQVGRRRLVFCAVPVQSGLFGDTLPVQAPGSSFGPAFGAPAAPANLPLHSVSSSAAWHSALNRHRLLAPLDQLRVRLKDAENLLVVGHRLAFEHTASSGVAHLSRQVHVMQQLRHAAACEVEHAPVFWSPERQREIATTRTITQNLTAVRSRPVNKKKWLRTSISHEQLETRRPCAGSAIGLRFRHLLLAHRIESALLVSDNCQSAFASPSDRAIVVVHPLIQPRERNAAMRRAPLRYLALALTAGLVVKLLAVQDKKAAFAPPVQELRIQKVGDITYFHVRLAAARRWTAARGQQLQPWLLRRSHAFPGTATRRGRWPGAPCLPSL